MKKKFNIKKTLMNLIITTGAIFTIVTIIFSSISQYVFKNITFAQHFLLIFAISLVASILLLLIFRINKISTILQVIFVYIFLSIVVLAVGYFLYIYDFVYNYKLLISTIICLVSGLIIISVVFAINYKINDRSLNDNLKHFKERDR